MSLPNCYRCGCQPCECADGITLYHADCREVLPLLKPGSVDLVLTDPPSGLNWSGGTWARLKHNQEARRWDKLVDEGLVQTAINLGREAIVWSGNYYRLPPARCWLAWVKTNAVPTMADFELAWTSMDRPAKAWTYHNNLPKQHAAQKPLALMRWCIEKVADAHTILDPFTGSGTTLRAAKDLGRRAIGIEIEEKYCEIAARRLDQEVGHWMREPEEAIA